MYLVHDAQGIFHAPHTKVDAYLKSGPLGENRGHVSNIDLSEAIEVVDAYIPTSSRMMLQLTSMLNPIHARNLSTGFLAGGGGTTTSSTFSAMIE